MARTPLAAAFPRIHRVSGYRGLGCGALTLFGLCLALPAAAQSIGGEVEHHVDQGLKSKQRSSPPKKKKKTKARTSKKAPPRRTPEQRGYWSGDPNAATQPKAPETKYPIRILGGGLRIDPGIGGAYRGWRPQGYPALDVSTQNYYTWSVDVGVGFFGWVTLHHGYFESNSAAAPSRPEAAITARAGNLAPKLTKALGVIGFPAVSFIWEPIFRYETRAFETTVTPRQAVRVIPHSASPNQPVTDFPLTTRPLTMVSGFESFIVGVKYNHDKDPTGIVQVPKGDFPEIYFGLGLTSYSKPYQVRVDDFVLDELVFDARFRGAGLAFGGDTNRTPTKFYGSLSSQVGLGEVLLLDDYSLNDALPDDWLIGYVQGDLTFGYLHPLLKTAPTLLGGIEATVGGMTFFYFKTFQAEGERETPPLNWDFLWGLRAYLTLPL
ncbi:MAG: hypothetical protein H6718_05835 [Polyangiaceae bacterium]|nr:hypothetical protein [Polyangiaceae bacterium]MCB9607531.1 hypothetical protein [Polyangiaceae bacterium]